MNRLYMINVTLLIFYISFLFPETDAFKFKRYSTGIADIVRTAFQSGLNRFIDRKTSYDSDVFHYTLAQQKRGYDVLFAGESCRLSPTVCSHDEQCCTGRCLCRRWTITNEQRCIRKCF